MGVEEKIRERLSALAPDSLEVFDDSRDHEGHAGAKAGGGHYEIVMVSGQFAGKSAVARHRLIYAALSDLMPGSIHALAIRAYAPEELGSSANVER
ncbi:MAG TPA: BolA family protein [Burkholderiales bacterium]|nr:BolA family protein [Burkholderiales bacterium]